MVGLPTSGVVVVVFVPWQPKTPLSSQVTNYGWST